MTWRSAPVVCLLGLGLCGLARGQSTIPRRLTLEEAERLMTVRNQLVSGAQSMVEANEAAKTIAGYKPNPVLQLGAEQIPVAQPAGQELMNLPRFFTTDSNAGANPVYTLQVSKQVERGGKRALRVGQAEALVGAARQTVQDVSRQQLFLLRQAFGSAILARENLVLAEAADAQYGRTEQLTMTKVQAGDLASVEQYRVRTGRLQFQQAVLQAKSQYQQAVRDILNVLHARADEVAPAAAGGAFPDALRDAPLEIAGTFDGKAVAAPVEELKRLAMEERADVQAARFNLRATQKATELAQAQRRRDVNVALEYQRVGSDSSVGVVAQIPLFVYNDQRAAAVQASATQRAAEAQYRQAQMQASTDVEKAWQAHLTARRAVELYSTDNLKQVENLRRVAEFSFREGAVSLFELLDAQRTANLAMQAYNQARADYQMSLWMLEQAIGRALP